MDGDIVDGRKPAAQMMVNAWRRLIPYVKDCPACSWRMFGALASDAVGRAEAEWERTGKVPAMRFWNKDVADYDGGFRDAPEMTAVRFG